MAKEMTDLERVNLELAQMLADIKLAYPEPSASDPRYIMEWNRYQAYKEVMTTAALGIPREGLADRAAIDSKTAVRLLTHLLELQIRHEAKTDNLAHQVKWIWFLMTFVWVMMLLNALAK